MACAILEFKRLGNIGERPGFPLPGCLERLEETRGIGLRRGYPVVLQPEGRKTFDGCRRCITLQIGERAVHGRPYVDRIMLPGTVTEASGRHPERLTPAARSVDTTIGKRITEIPSMYGRLFKTNLRTGVPAKIQGCNFAVTRPEAMLQCIPGTVWDPNQVHFGFTGEFRTFQPVRVKSENLPLFLPSWYQVKAFDSPKIR